MVIINVNVKKHNFFINRKFKTSLLLLLLLLFKCSLPQTFEWYQFQLNIDKQHQNLFMKLMIIGNIFEQQIGIL